MLTYQTIPRLHVSYWAWIHIQILAWSYKVLANWGGVVEEDYKYFPDIDCFHSRQIWSHLGMERSCPRAVFLGCLIAHFFSFVSRPNAPFNLFKQRLKEKKETQNSIIGACFWFFLLYQKFCLVKCMIFVLFVYISRALLSLKFGYYL